MSKGWLGIGRKLARTRGLPPDSAVAAPRSWLVASVIVASTAALLGTSPDDPPSMRYQFYRALDEISTELTTATPSQRYVIALRADSLGADDTITTADATARVIGAIQVSGLSEGTEAPFVEVVVTPQRDSTSEVRALTSFDTSAGLTFSGDCETPTQGEPCTSELVVELRRLDDGARGGSLTVAWQVELTATATASREAPDVHDELPWTAEVTLP